MSSNTDSSYDQKHTNATAYIHGLPVELIQRIAVYLENQDLVALHSTGRQLRAETEHIFAKRLFTSVTVLSHPIGVSMLTELSRSPECAKYVQFVTVFSQTTSGREDEHGVAALAPVGAQYDNFAMFQLLDALQKLPNIQVIAAAHFISDTWITKNFKGFNQSPPFGHRQIQRLTGLDILGDPEDVDHYFPFQVGHHKSIMDVLTYVKKQRPHIQLQVAARFEISIAFCESQDTRNAFIRQWETWAPLVDHFSWKRTIGSSAGNELNEMDLETLSIEDEEYERSDMNMFGLIRHINHTPLRLKRLRLHRVRLQNHILLPLFRRCNLREIEINNVALLVGTYKWVDIWSLFLAYEELQSLHLSQLVWLEEPWMWDEDYREEKGPVFATNPHGPWMGRAQVECGLRSLIETYQPQEWIDISRAVQDVSMVRLAEET
ncbi:hypothetical protein DM02DRAFT_678947 [Periconia macrospinosa]|uniref:F-box domain-containing protein n=1 Tax=Periconia macrospinosa TaxID=97972 RepID=A0A2V1EGA6_9PLEO|nr:hypothetical protein DM02DRAFT_678947 [Periconia macrospinosa]